MSAMGFYYTDHSFDIICLSKLKKEKLLSWLFIKTLIMLHFCVKIVAQKDWIMSKVLLSIFTLIIQENAPVTQLQQIIS